MYKFKEKGNYKFDQDDPTSNSEPFLDLSLLGPKDEDADKASFKWSKDGKYMAYVTTQHGSDWKKIRLVDLGTGKDVENEVISKVKFSGPTWDGESRGFFYGRFDSDEEKNLKYKGTDP